LAGYLAITAAAGFVFELLVGSTLITRAFGEPILLKFAHAFEQAT
jgi:Asp-tRNA(Asn)/Glu-tRNA(Gln) amidotransferase A subunit family amidase